MFHHTLRSFVFVGVLALDSAVLAQELMTHASEERERVDEARAPVVFEGFVYTSDGSPAEGALVVTSSGGKAVVDVRGHYRIEARVPEEARLVQVTAVGSNGRNLAASASIGVSATSGSVAVEPLELVQGSTCSPSWLPTFGGAPGTDGNVQALAVYDDGGGPALYAGGTISIAGGVLVSNIARWDGSSWSALGSGVNGGVIALAEYDDRHEVGRAGLGASVPGPGLLVGSGRQGRTASDPGGPALYAAGSFTTAGGVVANRIARWNGSSWRALGSGMNNEVFALVEYDDRTILRRLVPDGGGPALYAGGRFTTAGGVAANHIARWDGSSWSTLGSGINGTVSALAVYDDGRGPALYVGGNFTTAGGVAANRIARWDGLSWSAVGSGMNGIVSALSVFDDGGGPAFYAAGDFTTAGGVAANNIARWDGSSWYALGSGISGGNFPGPAVHALGVYDDGDGPALYAGGDFTAAGGVSVSNIARWNGESWSPAGSNLFVPALAVYDDGNGPALYAGGSIARWNGSSWSVLGSGMNGSVSDLAVYEDGGGPALYVAGGFTTAGGGAMSRFARWNGSSWSDFGSGMNGSVYALAVYDDGGGPALYAGGSFTTVGGVAANYIARWDGSSWSALGSGMVSFVNALAVYDDGRGPTLYAGGELNRVARWDGSSWSALGSGLSGTVPDSHGPVSSSVYALAVYDDGGGPALYAGGSFTFAGGMAANRIARWDGSSWSALGSGTNNFVYVLAEYDDGSGPALYAGGIFTSAGGSVANRIARWDGSSWSALGSGMNSSVGALAVHDDGGGPALYAGGSFTTAGGVAANNIVRWDGSSWSALGRGMNAGVGTMAAYNDGSGPALYAGGAFRSAIDSHDSYLAKWGCPDTTPPVLERPASITVLDGLGNGQGEVVTFTVTATDALDPSPSVVCTPPSGSFFPLGTTVVNCTAIDASGNVSTCQFPVEVRTKLHRRR